MNCLILAGRKNDSTNQSNRKAIYQKESNKSNNNNNNSNNNNNRSNYNRKQTKPTSASSLVARLSLFERLLANRGERFRVNQSDADSATSLSDLAAELSDEMGTLIDLMNLMGDLPSSRDPSSPGPTGPSIEDSFPTDELFELTSAAAGLLLSESESRFPAEASSEERSKSRVSSTLKDDDKPDDCSQQSLTDLTSESDVRSGFLKTTESQDSLIAGESVRS